jgi:hypothetical protein
MMSVVALGFSIASPAGASNRRALSVATTSGSGGVLLVAGGAVFVLGVLGFILFSYARKKRKPNQCAEQRDALELAERAVQYWEAARAHLAAVERARTVEASDGEDATHATLVANALEGLKNAVQQRDERQMDLIRCMATGVPGVPVTSQTQVPAQPFFTPETGGPSTPTASGPN